MQYPAVAWVATVVGFTVTGLVGLGANVGLGATVGPLERTVILAQLKNLVKERECCQIMTEQRNDLYVRSSMFTDAQITLLTHVLATKYHH